MKISKMLICIFMILLITSCAKEDQVEKTTKAIEREINSRTLETREILDDKISISRDEDLIKTIEEKYKDKSPSQWGEKVDGVINSIETTDQVLALTFDACGGERGNDYDKELIELLKKENISSTLFINSRWIDENPQVFKELSENPLFEIENHGHMHKPLSVNGKAVYGINGTKSPLEVIDEVYLNEVKIHELTGRKPKYFRSGTAYYDDLAVQIVKELGEKPVNFDIIGDGGARFSKDQVKQATLEAKNGSIIIYHMNQPSGETKEGLEEALPILKEKGFKFVKLEDEL